MGSGKTRWKLSFHRSSSTPSPTSSPARPPTPPLEFTCPISGSLMADPVIIPSGQTFERACIQACLDVAFVPPDLDLNLDLAPSSTPFLLIPNVALKSAIFSYCDRVGLGRPSPIPPDAARHLVQTLMPAPTAAQELPPSKSRSSSSGGEAAAPTTPPLPLPPTKTPSCFSPPTSSSSSYHSSSSYSSTEIVVETLTTKNPNSPKSSTPDATADPPAAIDSLENEILARLKDPQIAEQEAALLSLRLATRESRDRRIALCTPRLLAALRPFLLSRYAALQSHANASLVNLSLEPPNKVRIVRSGAVPPLVDVLRCGHPEARDHAAGVLFSLALDDENKAAIGVLGAVPPLLHLFSRPSAGPRRARRDAGMALYHLSLAGTNRTKLARAPGAVRALLAVASEVAEEDEPAPTLARLALMVICNLAGYAEGRAALMDAGAVAGVVGLMRSSGARAGAGEEECCVAAMYGMSRGSLRFKGLARAAGAEEVLVAVAEGGGGDVAKETARRTLRALRGEEEDGDFGADEGGSVVSDGLVSFRRRYKDFGGVSGANSAEF